MLSFQILWGRRLERQWAQLDLKMYSSFCSVLIGNPDPNPNPDSFIEHRKNKQKGKKQKQASVQVHSVDSIPTSL